MNINTLIKQFFVESDYDKLAERLVVLRQDGIDLYSNINNKFETSPLLPKV